MVHLSKGFFLKHLLKEHLVENGESRTAIYAINMSDLGKKSVHNEILLMRYMYSDDQI